MKNLYLTAVLPPEELAQQIDSIRKECSEMFEVYAALRPPVHITLFRPFSLEPVREAQLIKILAPIGAHHHPFEINLENFSTFNTHTVFINVLKNEALTHLQHEISSVFAKNKIDPKEVKGGNTAFHPHITIAYRDIPAKVFPEIWEEYKNKKFKRKFQADAFYLLKHDGKKWQPFKEFRLCKPQELSLFGS